MARKRAAARRDEDPALNVLTFVWSVLMWITGLLVSLAVGFGMANRVLVVPWIPSVITVIAGWIVVVLVLLGAVIALIDKLSN